MKKSVLFLLFAFVCFTLMGNPVELQRASHVAASWLEHMNSIRGKSVDLRIAESYSHRINDQIIFHIINFEPRGFVMVAGNDASVPILGYSLTGHADLHQMPPAFTSFVQAYEEAILEIYLKGLSNVTRIEQWQQIEAKEIAPPREQAFVESLLKTEWNQNDPWNAACPADTAGPGGHVLAGCVAVAMGQIMKYWEYPNQGTGSHWYNHSDYGQLEANFGETTYEWADMPDVFPTSSTQELLFHLGVSVNMKYGPKESGAYSHKARQAMINYFDYSADALLVYRRGYPFDLWSELLKSHLDNNIPLYYTGRSGLFDNGHAFVCDGYDEYGNFHFNWGWSGDHDGYFHIDSLNPKNKDYSSYQSTIINLYPSNLTMPPLDGEGIAGNPYRISTLQNLKWIAEDTERWSYDYIQTADIDASATQYWNNGQGWEPIGFMNSEEDFQPFEGTYNGNGFVIDGLYINRPGQDHVGLFGYTYMSSVKNLGVTNANVTGKDWVGALMGVNYCIAEVVNCFSSGTVSGQVGAGGLVGVNSVALISKSYNLASVQGTDNTGGLLGMNAMSEVESSFNAGIVMGAPMVGGLVGTSYESTVNNSYNEGDVIATEYAGGLVGFNMASTVSNSYNRGHVNATIFKGGLIGDGFSSTVTNSYWNTETSGQENSAGGLGRTTEQMTWPHSNDTYETWNMNQVWSINYLINDGYPFHQWNHALFPMNLAGNAGNGFVELSWEYPGMEDKMLNSAERKESVADKKSKDNKGVFVGFNIYRDYVVINEEPLDEPWYLDRSIINGNYYKYWVTMVFENFESPASNMVRMYPYFPFPYNLEAVGGNNYVLLAWQPPLEAGDTIFPVKEKPEREKEEDESVFSGYRVYRGNLPLNAEPLQDTLFMDVDVTNNVAYRYQVTAVYSDGESDPTNRVEVRPRAPIPRGLTAHANTESIFLTWQEPEDPASYGSLIKNGDHEQELLGYRVFRDTLSLNMTPITELEYTDFNVSPRKLYRYTVKAVYSTTVSLPSNVAEAMLMAGVEPPDGDGSEQNPFHIATLDNLYWITEDPSRWGYHYIQVAHIGAAETRDWFDGKGWVPIGRNHKSFLGTYDGQEYIIDGLYMDGRDLLGLFGKIGKRDAETVAQIKNLGITNIEIHGRSLLGGLAGYAENAFISSCFSTGYLYGVSSAGGLIGDGAVGLVVENSFSSVQIDCTNSGNNGNCGGFAGMLYNCEVTGSFSAGDVDISQNFAGGFAGRTQGVSINNSYAMGNVSGNEYVGGFAGFSDGIAQFTHVYSRGLVSSPENINTGGLMGFLHPTSTATNSYWNTETSGQEASSGGSGRTTGQMTSPHASNTYVNWNFYDIWEEDDQHIYNNGYPYLQWQNFFPDPVVVTHGIMEIGLQTATANGNIVFAGHSEVTAHGFCWDTAELPDLDCSHSNEGAAVGPGAFTSVLTGLEPATQYYLRAYLVHDGVVEYGNQMLFSTLAEDDEEPEEYEVVLGVDPPEAGTVQGGGNYIAGAQVSINATPLEGYLFIHWTGDAELLEDATQAVTTFTMPEADVSLTAHFDPGTGTAAIENRQIRVYPNPASRHVNIEVEGLAHGQGTIELFSLHGENIHKILLEGNGKQIKTMDVSALYPGVYMLYIKGEHFSEIIKLVIGW